MDGKLGYGCGNDTKMIGQLQVRVVQAWKEDDSCSGLIII